MIVVVEYCNFKVKLLSGYNYKNCLFCELWIIFFGFVLRCLIENLVGDYWDYIFFIDYRGKEICVNVWCKMVIICFNENDIIGEKNSEKVLFVLYCILFKMWGEKFGKFELLGGGER